MASQRKGSVFLTVILVLVVMSVPFAGILAMGGVDFFEEGFADVWSAQSIEGFSDLSHVDLEKVQTSALAAARERWSDATIISFSAQNVYPEGYADLTLGEDAGVTVTVGSPSLASESSLPKGASGSEKAECLSVAYMNSGDDDLPGVNPVDRLHVRTMRTSQCREAFEDVDLPPKPHCSVQEIWARAIENNAPDEDAVAQIIYSTEDGVGFWLFSIGDHSQQIQDDCGVATKDPKSDEPDKEAETDSDGDVRGRVVNHTPPEVRGSLEREAVQRVVRKHRHEIKHCYETQLRKDQSLAGEITVKLTLASTGHVVSSISARSTLKNRALQACMHSKIRRWVFPEPEGDGIVVVRYPFRFAPD